MGTGFRGVFPTYIAFLCEIKFSGAVFEWCNVVGTLTEGDLDRRPCHHLTRSPEKYQGQYQIQMLFLFHRCKMNQMKKLQYKCTQMYRYFIEEEWVSTWEIYELVLSSPGHWFFQNFGLPPQQPVNQSEPQIVYS